MFSGRAAHGAPFEPVRELGRRSVWIRLVLWACVYGVLAVAALGANPLGGETVGPFDLLARHAGWNPDGQPVEVRHHERSDILDALLPNWLEARRQLRDGTAPLWNPLAAGGSPALFDPTKAELTVGFAIFALAPNPALGFYLAVVACMVIGGLGMHWLVVQDRSHVAGLLAGTGFMLSGFVTAWLYWPHVHTAIWIPWLLLGVRRYVVDGRLGNFYGIVLATALMLLGGFPFVAVIGLGAAVVYTAFAAAKLDRRIAVRRGLGTLGAIILAFMLVAVSLLTLASGLESAELAHRRGGSPFGLADARLLWLPRAADQPHVESNMYVGMAALVLAVVALWPIARRRGDALAWAALAFVAVGAVLTFGLLPAEIGNRLPVLSNNPWSRAILLLDIGLLLLAATGMDQLRAWFGSPHAGLLLALALIAGQWLDLSAQFRKFNGPVPSRYFYAVDPELQRFASQLPPFQYVAHDNGHFMVSGTLGAVGLGDWFAHSLRSPGMRSLLGSLAENPFTTPTATSIGLRQYAWQSAAADAAGLCYAIHGPSQSSRPVLLQAPGSQRVPLGPINSAKVRQAIEVPEVLSASAIALRVATYRAVDMDGVLRLSLRSADGTLVAPHVTVPATRAKDNAFLEFDFPTVVELPAGSYELELEYSPGPKNRNLTVWVLTDKGGEVMRGGGPRPGRIEYRLLGTDANGLAVRAVGPRAVVAFNPGCAPGAYWTGDADADYSADPRARVDLIEYRPDRFRFDVRAAAAGRVVVPMQHAPGWTARVNGSPAVIRVVHGVMPVVDVPAGRSRIEFAYAPPRWKAGVLLSAIALAVLGWLGWRARKQRLRARAPLEYEINSPN
jgi:hypothetical protein